MTYYPTNYRYDRKNRIRIGVSLNIKTEPELTAWIMDHEHPSTYLKKLALDDMKRHGKEEEEK